MKCGAREEGKVNTEGFEGREISARGFKNLFARDTRQSRSKFWVGGAKFCGWAGNIAGRPMDDGWLKQIDYL